MLPYFPPLYPLLFAILADCTNASILLHFDIILNNYTLSLIFVAKSYSFHVFVLIVATLSRNAL